MPGLCRLFRVRGPCVGLDAGAFSVKGVRLAFRAGKPVVERKAEIPVGGEPAEAIRKAVAELSGSTPCPVVSAVGGTGTLLRAVSLPKMTPQELRSCLAFEAEKYIPFKTDEVHLDFAVQGVGGEGRMEVLLAVARKEKVEAHLELLSRAGVSPAVVDLEMAALANAWELAPEGSGPGSPAGAEPGGVGLLHVGRTRTIVNCFAGGTLKFSREIETGPAPKAVWEEWFSQVRVSLDFYEQQSGSRIERLSVSGGAALTEGFTDWLAEASGFPVGRWDVLSALDAGGEPGFAFPVAVGLAAREASE